MTGDCEPPAFSRSASLSRTLRSSPRIPTASSAMQTPVPLNSNSQQQMSSNSQHRTPLSEPPKKEGFEGTREERGPPSPDPLPSMLSQQQLQQHLLQQQQQQQIQQQQQQLLQQQQQLLYQQTGLSGIPPATLPMDLSLESSVAPPLGVTLGVGNLNCTHGAGALSTTGLGSGLTATAPVALGPDGFYYTLSPLDSQCCLPLLPGGPVYSVAPAFYPTWTNATAWSLPSNSVMQPDAQLQNPNYTSPPMWNGMSPAPQKTTKAKRQQRCCC